jgi:hypothetical protein
MRRPTVLLAIAVHAAAIALAHPSPAAAQDGSFLSRTSLSGFIDTYYAYNFNRPQTPCAVVDGVAIFNCLHAFDVAQRSFSLNLAALALEKRPTADSRGGFRFDVMYGPGAALIADAGTAGISQDIQQAYVSFVADGGGRLQFDFGKFLTPAGIEKINPADNWNASRSLLFALAIPRDHAGLRAVYTPNDRIRATGFVANGWSDVAPNAGAKQIGISVSVRAFRAVTLDETYIGGPESATSRSGWRGLSDTVIAGRLRPDLSVAINFDAGNDRSTLQSWRGVAAYLRYQPTDWFSLVPRLESLQDPNGFMTGVSQDLQEATLTAELRGVRGVVMRLEYRIDVTDRPYLLRGVSNTVRTQPIVLASLAYVFNSPLDRPKGTERR